MAYTKRKTALKAEAQEVMREKLSYAKTLASIVSTENALQDMMTAEEEPSNARIGAARTLLDSKWKRINKILPDLKAIEMSGEVGVTLPAVIRETYVGTSKD